MSEILDRGVFLNCLLDQTEAPWEVEVEMIRCHDAALRLALETATRENQRLRDMIEIEREGQRSMAQTLSEIRRLSDLNVAINHTASRPMTRVEADAVEEIESAMFAAPPAAATTEAVMQISGMHDTCDLCQQSIPDGCYAVFCGPCEDGLRAAFDGVKRAFAARREAGEGEK